jgi:hypothetical protein
MKFFKIFFAWLIFLISTNAFCFGSYVYTPFDENDYYGGDNSYYENNNHDNNTEETTLIKKSFRHSGKTEKHSQVYSGPGKTFVFDPKALRWYAYYNGSLIHSGRASGGRHYCPDLHRGCRTPCGVFRISSKGGPGCKSKKFPIGRGNAPMPWCMFFHKGFAIHGSGSVPGYNASHGCIRVPPSDARWLNNNFLSPGSKVIVRSYH